MYICPHCKGKLEGVHCLPCAITIDWSDGVPAFFTGSPLAARYRRIALFYDTLYRSRQDVWKDEAGRTAEFINYMKSLIESFGPERYLDVGCGEGFLLSAVSAPEKFGIEISRKAIESTRRRTTAQLCQGYVEELPYPTGYFDVVTSMGVMEHFLDDVSATKEIHRVLRAGGRYIVEVYYPTIPLTERIMLKVAQFLYPRFRPVALAQWALTKYSESMAKQAGNNKDRLDQPVTNFYTPRSAKRLFQRAGFEIVDLITKRRVPDVPLPGHRLQIYILER